MRPRRRYARIGVTSMSAALLAAAFAVAGCGSINEPSARPSGAAPVGGSAGTSTPGSTGPTDTSGSGTPGASAASGAPGAADAERCHTTGLSVRLRQVGAGAGHRYTAVVFTNTGDTGCQVYGYPGMQLLDGSGGTIATTVVRDPSSTPHHLTLRPHGAAWSRAGWSAVPGSGEGQKACARTPASVEVTPPDETDHTIVRWPDGPVCQHGRIVVSPLVRGDGPRR